MSLPAADNPMTARAVVRTVALATAPGALPAVDDGGRLVGASLALALLRAIPEAAYIMEADGRVTYVNAAGLRDLGATAPQGRLFGSYLWDLWPDVARDSLRRAAADACEGETVVLSDLDCPVATGAMVGCSVSFSPVEDSDGKVSKILVLVRRG